MKKNANLWTACITGLVMMTSSLIADASNPPSEKSKTQEHVSIGSRPMSPEKQALMQEKRSSEIEKEDSEEQSLPIQKAKLHQGFKGKNFRLAPQHKTKAMFVNTYYSPYHSHWMNSISLYGDVIELEDGSSWSVATDDAYKTMSWRIGDALVISPNYSWFSNYNYYITNKSTGSYVRVNPFVGPLAFGPYTHWIVAINHQTHQVTLENGTTWNISYEDSYLFQDWAINDTIIIGVNDAWFTSYNSILINVNMNTFARSKQF